MKAFFLHDEHRFPVALVVTELKMHGILFAVATHNPIDFFDKRIAWQVATGRLMTRNNGGTFISAGNNVKARILQHIVSDSKMPNRTRRAAQLWLDNPPTPKKKKDTAA
jgi:hypothetical protein